MQPTSSFENVNLRREIDHIVGLVTYAELHLERKNYEAVKEALESSSRRLRDLYAALPVAMDES
jgi:hypothetical protein